MRQITGEEFVRAARCFRGAKFGHQGRTPERLDCGGLILLTARTLGLTDFEFLSYANYPKDGKFEALMREHADDTGEEFRFPFRFEGTEFLPGDLVTVDYGNGEGVRHIGIITKFERRRFLVIDATPEYGVVEHPLAVPLITTKTVLRRYLVRGLSND